MRSLWLQLINECQIMQQTGEYIIFFNGNTKSLWCVNNIHVVNLNYITIFFSTLCSFTVGRWKWIFFIALWSSSRYKHILSFWRSFLAVIVGHMQPFGSLLFFAALKFIMHVRSFRKYFWNTEKGIFSAEVLNSALQDQQI